MKPRTDQPASSEQGFESGSENLFQTLCESVPVGIFHNDERGNCTYANPACREIIGIDGIDGRSFDWATALHAKDRQRVLEGWKKAVDDATTIECEFRVCQPKGSVKWVHASVSPHHQNQRHSAGCVGTLTDITNRKQIEADLNLRANALASTTNAIVIADATSSSMPIIYCNSAFERLTGYTKEEVLGRNCRFLQGEDRDQSVRAAIREALDHGRDVTTTLRNYRKDGSLFWTELRISPVHDPDGRLTHFLGIQIDITDRRQAELALQESEERFRRLCVHAPVGIFMSDAEGHCTYINDVGAEIVGLTSPQVVRRGWFAAIHSADRQRVTEHWTASLDAVESFSSEFRFQHPCGAVLWAQAKATPRRNDAGELTGFIGTVLDITARHEADQFLEMENELLASFARGTSLSDALSDLVRFIEDQSDDLVASVLLLDRDGVFLRHGAAPSLSPQYNEFVDGLAIGEGVGSCGTAAFRRQPVLTHDIETDPLWEPYRELARSEGFRACWSMPVSDLHGNVLGTFAIYRREPGGPTARHLKLIDTATHLASILLSRHRDEQNLMQSERRFRTIFEQAATGVAYIETGPGTILQVNQRYSEILGIPADELIGKTWVDLTHPDDLAEDLANMERMRSGEIREFAMEKRLQRCDGKYVWIHLTVSPTWRPGEQPTAHIAIVKDITERKRVEEELRLTKFSVDTCSTSIFWIRSDASFLYVNDAATHRFGYTRQQWLSQTVHDIDPAYPPEAWPEYWQTMQRERTMGFESQIRHINGSLIPVEISTNLMEFEGQEIVFAFVTDIASRKEMEDKLRTNAERLELAMSVNNDGMFDWDVHTGKVYFDARYYTMAGYQPDEFAGTYDQWIKRLHPEDLPATQQSVKAFLAGRLSDYDVEFRFLRKDRSWMWTRARIKVVARDATGKPLRIVGTHTDVTERKRAEIALRESEERWQFALEGSRDGVWDWDASTNEVYYSRRWKEMLGYREDEISSHFDEWEARIHPDDKERCDTDLTKHLYGETPFYENEHRMLCKDGSYKWILDRGKVIARSDEDKPLRVIGTHTDISKRKESERTLEFQADVLNQVSDAVLVTNEKGVVTYANEVADQLFHVTKRQRAGQTLPELHDELLVSGPDSDVIRSSLDEFGTWQGESDFRVDGGTRTYETKLKKFHLPGSDKPLLLSVVRDISMRAKAEQERRQHRDVLAHMTRLSTMGELVAGIAHEVKQPLYAIANFATAASISLRGAGPADLRDAEWFDDLREFNDGVRRASQRANEIIERLREFARKSEQRREYIDMNRVVRDSIDLVAFEARQCQARVETQLADPLPEVLADRIQCEQVVVNLLHNAYEALAKNDPPRRVIVRTRRYEGEVEIQVEDSGPGVPSDLHGRLFEAFCTSKPAGMGMGLAISRTIVEDHGGRMWVDVNEDGGATFHVVVPVASARVELPGTSRPN